MDFSLVLTLALFIQGAAGNPSTDALTFLNNVTQRYVDAKSYHIEAIVERSSSNELSRSWQKSLLRAIVAPGGRYCYEGHSGYGSAILVSNGTTKWVYHVDEHQYTEAAVSASKSKKGQLYLPRRNARDGSQATCDANANAFRSSQICDLSAGRKNSAGRAQHELPCCAVHGCRFEDSPTRRQNGGDGLGGQIAKSRRQNRRSKKFLYQHPGFQCPYSAIDGRNDPLSGSRTRRAGTGEFFQFFAASGGQADHILHESFCQRACHSAPLNLLASQPRKSASSGRGKR